MIHSDYESINESKANMDHIYNQTDPRGYFSELRKLEYVIPEEAKPVFETLIRHLQQSREGRVQVLDLGCSYGVNAAILKHDLTMDELYERWGRPELQHLPSEKVIAQDRAFFSDLDARAEIDLVGIDPAEKAVAFAEDVGLLDAGLPVNLESEPLPKAAENVLAPTDLIMSTGCVGYVTERTFEALLPVVTQDEQPWIANFVLRMFPFDRIADTLGEWGYVTERLEDQTFFQRRFSSAGEQHKALQQLQARDIDPAGEEANGRLVADLYLSRPASEAAARPIEELLTA